MYGLDHHIPTRLNNNRIYTEFEQFYQGILRDISYIPGNYLSSLKTKLENACEKYSKIWVPCKYTKIIGQLSRNKDLCILQQHKGCGVMLMDRTKYINKYLELLLQIELKERQNNYWESLNLDCHRKIIINYTQQILVLENFTE